MFLRIDKLPVELPAPTKIDPEAASAVQELMGGRFGEMSTFNNYFAQSMNLRGKKKLGAYYELVANITAEELGHIQVVGATINSLLNGPEIEMQETGDKDPLGTPIKDVTDTVNNYNPHHFIAAGRNSLPVNANGAGPWSGDYVFSSGNLILDLLHNFFLENAARTNKLHMYQMVDDPSARTMLGYLFVRGGVHAVAYGKALEKLTGVKMTDMLPIPKIGNAMFPEAKKFMDIGLHEQLYRSSPDDYKNMGQIWDGTEPDTNKPVSVVDAPPTATQGEHVALAGIGGAFTGPDYHPEEIFAMAQKLYKKAKS